MVEVPLGGRASAGGEFGLGPEGAGGDDGDSADGVEAGVEAGGEALGVGAVTGDGVGDTVGVLLGDGTGTADGGVAVGGVAVGGVAVGGVAVGGVAVGGEAVGAAPGAWAMHDVAKRLKTIKTWNPAKPIFIFRERKREFDE
ncbi:hypothetical protein ACFX15_018519 [Malus domestica]|uniref:Uncharacterized protein n=1 Tax=Malus domestica TaxID=3750 RepID=A0A498HWV9_MALDO|nr:hypothetical protein DVH24_021227 [Malus domestica]